MIHPDDRTRVNEHIRRVLAGEELPPIEHRIVHRNGTIRWIRDTVVLHPGESGQPDRYDGLVEDVTERKEADELFRQLVESAPDAIVIVDQEGKITIVNAQTERMFDYPRDQLLGQPVEVLVPDRFRAGHRQHCVDYLAAPRTRPLDVELNLHGRRRDGSEFPVEITLSPLRTDGQLLAFSAIRDVSARKRMEQLLRESEARMLAAQRIQERLLPEVPPDIAGLDVHAAVWPAEFVAGDYFDYFATDGRLLTMAVGDVSGHGVGAGLLAAYTHAGVRSLSRLHLELDEILQNVNQVLWEDKTEQFVTLLLARVDPTTGTLVYLNAGHPTGYVIDCRGDVKARLESQTIPLGASPDTAFPEHASVQLDPGDIVLLVSDGVLEATGHSSEQFGTSRLLEAVRGCRDQAAREIVARLGSTVRDFAVEQLPRDDMTVLVMKLERT
jgi:sigma-B regulation protein RsbU (phosphoserine phosphatase)